LMVFVILIFGWVILILGHCFMVIIMITN
jgi:hypothetical protein